MPTLPPRPPLLKLPLLAGALALCLASGLASAQRGGGDSGATTTIYTCIDAQGRRLTSDRPIMECIDREQREFGRSGTLRRVIPPAQTAAERQEAETRARQAAIEAQRQHDIEQRDQALIDRYPNKAAHEAGRKDALEQSQALIDLAEEHIANLTQSRQDLDTQMEPYHDDPSKAPARLRRALSDNDQQMQVQRGIVASQKAQRANINELFDRQAQRLQPLWQARAAAQQNK
jgi:hypothetical protein